MREVRHVYPDFDDEPPHVTGGAAGRRGACWCRPTIKAPCDQCGGDGDCWKCGGSGLATVGDYDDAPAVVVVHNAAGAKGMATSEAP